jgi:hypothetical protein
MKKFVAILIGMVGMLYLAGCGGSSTPATTTVPADLTTPTAPAATAAQTRLGGAIQGTALVIATPAAVLQSIGGIAGFSNISSVGSATFNRPVAVTTDGTYLYVADSLNNAIRQIDIITKHVTTIGNASGAVGSQDGIGAAAFFNRPKGITTDGTNLYVADSGNFTIRKIVFPAGAVGAARAAGATVATLAGVVGGAGSVDAIGLNARFNVLNGITTDGISLYVSDSNNTIRRILISDGTVTTLAGAPGTAGSTDGDAGKPSTARFNQPAGLTTDGPNLYVADYANSTIRRINLKTGTVTTIAGKVEPGGAAGVVEGVVTADSTDNTGSTARFNQPTGITCDGTNLYVTDSFYNTVRKVVLSSGTVSGAVSTLATNGASDKNTTYGITTDGVGLFITDFSMDNLLHTIKFIK